MFVDENDNEIKNLNAMVGETKTIKVLAKDSENNVIELNRSDVELTTSNPSVLSVSQNEFRITVNEIVNKEIKAIVHANYRDS